MSVPCRIIGDQVYFNVSQGMALFSTMTGGGQGEDPGQDNHAEFQTHPSAVKTTTSESNDTNISVGDLDLSGQGQGQKRLNLKSNCGTGKHKSHVVVDSGDLDCSINKMECILADYGLPIKEDHIKMVDKEVHLSQDAFIYLFFKVISLKGLDNDQKAAYLQICQEIAQSYKHYLLTVCSQNLCELENYKFSIPCRTFSEPLADVVSRDGEGGETGFDGKNKDHNAIMTQSERAEFCKELTEVKIDGKADTGERENGHSEKQTSVNKIFGDDSELGTPSHCAVKETFGNSEQDEDSELGIKRELLDDENELNFESVEKDSFGNGHESEDGELKTEHELDSRDNNKTKCVYLDRNVRTHRKIRQVEKRQPALANQNKDDTTVKIQTRKPNQNRKRKTSVKYSQGGTRVNTRKKTKRKTTKSNLSAQSCKLDCTQLKNLQSEDLKQFDCDRCDRKFLTEVELQKHSRAHSDSELRCPLCDLVFQCKVKVREHLESHAERKEFKCVHCDKIYTTLYGLKTHQIIHHGPFGEHRCDECQKVFNNPRSLEQHVKRVHKKRSLLCDFCGKHFDRESAYRAHVTKHRNLATGKHACQYCEKIFSSKVDKVQHERIHTGEAPLTCEFCGRAFKRAQNLRRHLVEIHSGIQHECPQCGKLTNSKHNMKRHISLMHEKNKDKILLRNRGTKLNRSRKQYNKGVANTSSTRGSQLNYESRGNTYQTKCLYVDLDKSKHLITKGFTHHTSNLSKIVPNQGIGVTYLKGSIGHQDHKNAQHDSAADHHVTDDQDMHAFYQLFAQPTHEVEVVTADAVDAATDPVFVAFQPTNVAYKHT
ncbi:zinc finger and BTB domain-containing protein 17 [Lingula anatina]|uniref:Zinc finger and BTB domain-containing protein 17 n=1 Tax=Lingula anatina TaxID=7574 RepID=A0A1S3K432_LINAN|nr:zinc finger and BTB domain-containing protein 17 [Lingula anatina]|eukprot:XP_013417393.1 zinc finger and BTB domain-containing protein 17 [Lingula anatina]